jgi:hypothetical protein
MGLVRGWNSWRSLRAIFDAPVVRQFSSFTGEIVSEIGISRPSFRHFDRLIMIDPFPVADVTNDHISSERSAGGSGG